jgi:hypothetical protein
VDRVVETEEVLVDLKNVYVLNADIQSLIKEVYLALRLNVLSVVLL